MSCPQLACIIHSVKLCCKNQPKLRKKAAVLARDVAAVCMGLRAAVMVDYVPLTASAMLTILAVAEMQATTLQQCQWPRLALLQVDDCLYLLCRDALQSRLEQLNSRDSSPAYIAVNNLHSTPCLAMASEHDRTEITIQLQRMCTLVVSATPGSSSSSCVVKDLTSVEGMPIMPTLSGWLLQYPVVYLARPDTAVVMAQLLSEAVLVLFDVNVAGPFIEDMKQLSASQEQLASMFVFTVPETVFSYCSAAVSTWKIKVSKRLSTREASNLLTGHSIVTSRLAPHNVQI